MAATEAVTWYLVKQYIEVTESFANVALEIMSKDQYDAMMKKIAQLGDGQIYEFSYDGACATGWDIKKSIDALEIPAALAKTLIDSGVGSLGTIWTASGYFEDDEDLED